MKRFDAFLISYCERFAAWVQMWTGKDCLIQARVGNALTALGVFGVLISDLQRGRGVPILYFMDGVMLLANLHSLFWGEPDDQEIRLAALHGLRNKNKLTPWGRLMALSWSLMTLIDLRTGKWQFISWMWGITLRYYFRACDPLPPCQSKFRSLLMAARRVPIVVP